MKIALDHQIFSLQQYGGISRYFTALLDEASLDLNNEMEVNLLFSNNAYIKDKNYFKQLFLAQQINKKAGLRYRINKLYGRLKVNTGNYDLIHRTFYQEAFKEKIPSAITVYDMINEKFPEYFKGQDKFLELKKSSILNSDLVLVISESTKKDLIDFYAVPEEKIVVTYLSDALENTSFREMNIEIPKRYILFVGNRSGYKNFQFFIESAVETLVKNELELLCVGGGAFTSAEKELIEKLGLQSRVSHMHFKEDYELKYFYQKALLFVFPSLYEGFGIPVLESMGAGCPVALSYSSSFPEVAGEAGIYFDPKSKLGIISAIEKVVTSEVERQKYIIKGHENYKRFSQKLVYQDTLNAYKKLQ